MTIGFAAPPPSASFSAAWVGRPDGDVTPVVREADRT
jgi:hypothetical protein